MLSTVDCAACAVVVAAVEFQAGLEWQVVVAVEPVAELAAVAGESVPIEVVPAALALVPELVGATGAVALEVAADVGPEPVALAGVAALEAVVAGPELEAGVVAAVVATEAAVVVAVLAAGVVEAGSAEATLVVVEGTAALGGGTARVLDGMADLKRRTGD